MNAALYPEPHDLASFFRAATQKMADDYERIIRHAPKDPGTAGDQGELDWKNLLRGWLPPTYQIVTKGKILTHTGDLSPQVDVLVLDPYYPHELLEYKYYLDAGVIAAFECKRTLRSGDISTAVQNAVKIRRSLKKRIGTPYHELHSPIIYGLLAHSHSWKGTNSTPFENITKLLYEKDEQYVEHPRECLDLMCVADLGLWTLTRGIRDYAS